jgi:hypothetical protein
MSKFGRSETLQRIQVQFSPSLINGCALQFTFSIFLVKNHDFEMHSPFYLILAIMRQGSVVLRQCLLIENWDRIGNTQSICSYSLLSKIDPMRPVLL